MVRNYGYRLSMNNSLIYVTGVVVSHSMTQIVNYGSRVKVLFQLNLNSLDLGYVLPPLCHHKEILLLSLIYAPRKMMAMKQPLQHRVESHQWWWFVWGNLHWRFSGQKGKNRDNSKREYFPKFSRGRFEAINAHSHGLWDF